MNLRLSFSLLKLVFVGYVAGLALIADIFSGYFIKNRLNITKECNTIYRIAIIDTAFDIAQFSETNIISPYNVTEHSVNISKIPKFDYSNNVRYENHGTSIVDLFVGKYGLLKNAQIIPIQVMNSIDLPEALMHAVRNHAQVISISLAFDRSDRSLPFEAKRALLDACRYCPILIAAGNDGMPLEGTLYGRSMLTLAAESNGKIFLVAANKWTLLGQQRAAFTNYAANYWNKRFVLEAPGQNIALGKWFTRLFTIGLSGTSIATPLMVIQTLYYADKFGISIAQALLKQQCLPL